MTIEQYEHFEEVMKVKGYKLCNARGTIHNEHFYYYKGYVYPDGSRTPGYQVIFLVWDHRGFDGPDDYAMGVAPLIITENVDWPRIDLEFTATNFDVDNVESYAERFYKDFVL